MVPMPTSSEGSYSPYTERDVEREPNNLDCIYPEKSFYHTEPEDTGYGSNATDSVYSKLCGFS